MNQLEEGNKLQLDYTKLAKIAAISFYGCGRCAALVRQMCEPFLNLGDEVGGKRKLAITQNACILAGFCHREALEDEA